MTVLLNAGEMLTVQASLQPNVIGVRDLDRSMTFAAWNARACQLANALRGLGMIKGDRIAVLAYNRIEWAEIYAAAAKAGLVVVPINFRLTPQEAAYIITDSGVLAVLVEERLLGIVEDIRNSLPLREHCYVHIGGRAPAGYLAYEDLIAYASDAEPAVMVLPDDPWSIMYTSGTTGHPKGAIRSHRGMAMLSLMTALEFHFDRHDEGLLVMPMCHANSLYFFAAFLYCGARMTIFSRPSFDPELCLAVLSQGPTFTSLVPTHYSMMLELRSPRQGAVATVEKLLISSAPAFADTKRAIMDMFPRSGLFELYGSTEAGWVTMLHPDEQFDHLGTVGREVVGSAPIRLLDDAGDEVADGAPGELFSCSPYQFDGYWKRPEKTEEAMRGNYLSVGDIACRDPNGYIRLIDRKTNMIISGGENIYPADVEQVLIAHPQIREVAVVGVADPKWSERVVAVVVCHEEGALEAATLMAWSHDRLAGFKRPREIVFLKADEMPKNATGKILHRRLRDMLNDRSGD